jgi:predicted nucleic acid-binding protein
LRLIWDAGKRGDYQIWTSAFCYAEVFKAKCEEGDVKLKEESDALIDSMFEQPHVKRVQVDVVIGRSARKLLREFPELRKPQDAIHLATALHYNLDSLHTYDCSNLLGLNGRVKRRDGELLQICIPDAETDGPLFAGKKDIKGDTKK